MFGCNDNPSAKQFESAWRKLLGQHQIRASESANCIENDVQYLSVLNTSSRKQATPNENSNNWLPSSFAMNFVSDNNNNQFENNELGNDMDEADQLLAENSNTKTIEEHVVAYLAAVIEKCVREGRWYNPIKCKDCLCVFSEDDLLENDFIKLKMRTSKLTAPAKSTVKICTETEKAMRHFKYAAGQLNQIIDLVLFNLDMNDLYWISDFSIHEGTNHKLMLVTLIIEMYVKKTHDYISKCNTLAAHNSLCRNVLKKLIHFRGQ